MSSTYAKTGYSTTFKWNDETIAEVKKIGGFEISAEAVEATDLSQAAKTYVSGIVDSGELTIEGNFYPGDTNGQYTLKSAVGGASQTAIITFPTAMATTATFTAICTKFNAGDAEQDNVIPFTATFKISGTIALAVTASAGLTTTFFSISESAVIVPAPANAVYEYVATVLTGVTSVTCTPIATAGVITVNGNVVATGQASSAITLGAAGSITDITIVVTETSKVALTYVIHVTRAAS